MVEPVRITYSLQDDHGDLEALPIFVGGGTELADAQTVADAYAAALDAVTGALIVGYNVTLPLVRAGGLKATVTADSWHDNGANYGHRQSGLSLRHTTRVPAIPPALIANGALIETGALAALIAVITASVTTNYQSRQGNDLTSFIGWERSKAKVKK